MNILKLIPKFWDKRETEVGSMDWGFFWFPSLIGNLKLVSSTSMDKPEDSSRRSDLTKEERAEYTKSWIVDLYWNIYSVDYSGKWKFFRNNVIFSLFSPIWFIGWIGGKIIRAFWDGYSTGRSK